MVGEVIINKDNIKDFVELTKRTIGNSRGQIDTRIDISIGSYDCYIFDYLPDDLTILHIGNKTVTLPKLPDSLEIFTSNGEVHFKDDLINIPDKLVFFDMSRVSNVPNFLKVRIDLMYGISDDQLKKMDELKKEIKLKEFITLI